MLTFTLVAIAVILLVADHDRKRALRRAEAETEANNERTDRIVRAIEALGDEIRAESARTRRNPIDDEIARRLS